MTRLSRRQLLTSGAAASMLAVTLPTQALSARKGVLRVAMPERGSQAFRAAVAVTTAFNRLTATDVDGGLRGELATSWEASSDARDWLMSLRPDVIFHDGSALTAKTVVASLMAKRSHVGPKFIARADGPHRVRIQLAEGDPGLPFLLSDPVLAIAKDGVGTGPYRADDAGNLRATETYFDTGRAGWFEGIDFVCSRSGRDAAEMVRYGQADIAELADPAGLRQHRGRPAVSRLSRPAALMISAHGPGALELATALRHGIDRTALLQTWLGGYGAIPHAGIADYDPDAARHAARSARLDRATLALTDDLLHCPATARLLQALARDARKFGVSLSLQPHGTADISLSLAPARMTRDATLAAHPRAGQDKVPHFAARLAAARLAHSTDRREDLLSDLEHDLARLSTTIVPVLRDMAVLHTPRLRLDDETRARSGPNVAERWAFA